jgi:hypothetical protein
MRPDGVPVDSDARGGGGLETTVGVAQTPGPFATAPPGRLLRVHVVPPAGATVCDVAMGSSPTTTCVADEA